MNSNQKDERPTLMTDELVEEILDRISDGEGLWKICADEHVPSTRTIARWRRRFEEFEAQYLKALRIGADSQFDELDKIARDGGGDLITQDGAVVKVDHENIQRSNLICNTIRWRLAKVKPEVYGDRTAIQALDENGKPAPKPGGVFVMIDGATKAGSENA